MNENTNNFYDNLILSDLVNDWILEPITDSKNRQNIVFRLTTKGHDYFKILNKNSGYPFKNDPTLQIMVKKCVVVEIIKKEGLVGYDLTSTGEQHHMFLNKWSKKTKN